MTWIPSNDCHLYLETSGICGSRTGCPAVEKHVGEQLHLEYSAAKERRKAAEEQSGAGAKKLFRPCLVPTGVRAQSGTCPGNGCGGQQRLAAPQGRLPVSSVVLVADTRVHIGGCSMRRRRERLAHWRAWHASVTPSMNELCMPSGPFQVDEILPVFKLSFALIWNALTWTSAVRQTTLPREPLVSSAAYAWAVTMTSVAVACNFSRGLPPYCVPGRSQSTPPVVLLLRIVGWLERGVTPCFATRKRLNSSVLSSVLSDLFQIPRWCDAPLDFVILLHRACQAFCDHTRQIMLKPRSAFSLLPRTQTTPRHI